MSFVPTPPPIFPPSSPSPSTPQQQIPASPGSFRFKEKADYEKGFEVYFEDYIKPVYRELELKRLEGEKKVQEAKKMGSKIFWIGILVTLALSVWAKNGTPFLFGLIILGAIKMGISMAPTAELAAEFKSKLLPPLVKFFGDFKYEPLINPDEKLLRDCGLFDGFNRVHGEEHISGSYRGRKFEFHELLLQYHSGSGKGSSTSTIFQGMLLGLEMKTTLQGKTIIKRDKDKGFWTHLTGKWQGMKNFQMPDPAFENIFETYSSNEMEAKMLVMPDLMTKLLKLNEMYAASGIRCAFFDNKMLIAIAYEGNAERNKMFESKAIWKLSLDPEELHTFLQQFHEILDVLDTVIGKKETT